MIRYYIVRSGAQEVHIYFHFNHERNTEKSSLCICCVEAYQNKTSGTQTCIVDVYPLMCFSIMLYYMYYTQYKLLYIRNINTKWLEGTVLRGLMHFARDAF